MNESQKRGIKRTVILSVLLSVIVSGAYVVGSWQSILPNGSDFLLSRIASPAIAGLSVVVMLVMFHAVAGVVFRFRVFTRELTTLAAIFVVVTIPFIVLGLIAGKEVRVSAFKSVAAKAEPVVNAVKQYQAKHGNPPATLDALVPEFISSVPETGIRVYPKFHFLRNHDHSRHNGNSWVLFVPVPIRGATHDALVYFPDQAYPKNQSSQFIRRIGDWAYVMSLGKPYVQ